MGLGLALVQLIVREHHGDVQVRSDGPGQGSEFSIRLPLAVGADLTPGSDGTGFVTTVQTSETSGDGDLSHEGKVQARKIVLVEDQADNRQMLTRWLELKGHLVESAADGPSGVTLIERVQPDIALVDIGLPKIDGYEVARRVPPAAPPRGCA